MTRVHQQTDRSERVAEMVSEIADMMSTDEQEVVRYRLEASEIDWEIAPGRKVRGYGFNGQVPGPVLEAKQGVPVEIEFTGETFTYRFTEAREIQRNWGRGLRPPGASRCSARKLAARFFPPRPPGYVLAAPYRRYTP
jgi:hypothetical protein